MVKILINENIRLLKTLNKSLNEYLISVIQTLENGAKNYSKIMTLYYPSIGKIESLLQFYASIIEDYQIKNQLSNLIQNNKLIIININRLNGLYYLYYYLSTNKSNGIKIPKFFYYQFPINGNKGFGCTTSKIFKTN